MLPLPAQTIPPNIPLSFSSDKLRMDHRIRQLAWLVIEFESALLWYPQPPPENAPPTIKIDCEDYREIMLERDE
jgi:hypothetical protein